MSPGERSSTGQRASQSRRVGAVLGLAFVAAAMWAAWLGWDVEYYEVDGVAQGPYREWQVIGCGLSVAAAAVLAQAWTRGSATVVALALAATVGFAVPWTVRAASTDDSGLFVVGLVMLLVGGVMALTILLTLTGAVQRRVPRPSSTSPSEGG